MRTYHRNHVKLSILVTLACAGGFLDVAKILIASGANVNLGQSTPLMEASQEGHTELVQYLIDIGAHVHQRTLAGDTSKHTNDTCVELVGINSCMN
jgi:ankyrin repeat protein